MTTGTDPATASHTATYYVVDKNRDYAQVLAEWTASWTGQTAPDPEDDDLAVTYRYGHDLIEQTRDPLDTPSTHYFHYDGQMSTRHLTDASGSPTDSYTYGAYGDLLASTGSTTNSYRYTGEQLDPDLGAANTPGNPDGSAGSYYLRARYYNPGQGRFAGQDPFAGVQHDPMSLHKYLYCGNNPINRADPSGQFSAYTQQIAVMALMAVLFAANYANAPGPRDRLHGDRSGQMVIDFFFTLGIVCGLKIVWYCATSVAGIVRGRLANIAAERAAQEAGEQTFSAAERSIVDFLRNRGRHVVKNLDEGVEGMGRQGDVFMDGLKTELKTLGAGADSKTMLNVASNSARRGGQAEVIVFDARGSGLTLQEAERGISRIFGATQECMQNIWAIEVIGDGFYISPFL